MKTESFDAKSPTKVLNRQISSLKEYFALLKNISKTILLKSLFNFVEQKFQYLTLFYLLFILWLEVHMQSK